MEVPKKKPPGSGQAITRRDVLVGAVAAAIAASAPVAMATPVKKRARTTQSARTRTSIRRYQAASAVLGDGRVLVTGGYDRPGSPVALYSVAILNPATGESSFVSPMSVARARHAAVSLPDGRVAVLGGLGMNATASVEIYDPATDKWESAVPLSMPRFDHNAVCEGGQIYIIGGSSQTMLASLETYQLRSASRPPRAQEN
jgi:hypothetical protein